MLFKLDVNKIRDNGRYEAYKSWFPQGISFDTVFEGDPLSGSISATPLKDQKSGYTYHLRRADISPFTPRSLKEWL